MRFLPVVFLGLTSCAWLDSAQQTVEDVKDAIEGMTNPLVFQGLVLGAEEPSNPDIADVLLEAGAEQGTVVNVFLADAASLDEVESAPVVSATVEVVTDDGVVQAPGDGNGLYSVEPGEDGATYADDGRWTVEVSIGEMFSTIAMDLPAAADVSVPELHDPLTPMDLDMTGQGFGAALVLVMDQNGVVTHTNEPQGVSDVIDLSQGGEDLTVYSIPADAFPDESLYVIGVAGLGHSLGEDVDNMNTLLSSLMAGKMRFYATSTVQLPTGYP